jgi:hypothetical protein
MRATRPFFTLTGISKPVHVLHRDAEIEEIVTVAAIAVVDAQDTKSQLKHEEGRRAQVQPEAALQPLWQGRSRLRSERQAGYTTLRSRCKLRSRVTSEARCRASSTFTAVNFSP